MASLNWTICNHGLMPLALRILFIVVLLPILAFCGFGFLATFELADASSRLPWQIGYGVGGAACLAGIVAVLVRPLAKR